jgi:hypothetical protein
MVQATVSVGWQFAAGQTISALRQSGDGWWSAVFARFEIRPAPFFTATLMTGG